MSVKTFVFNTILKIGKSKAEKNHKNHKPFNIHTFRNDIEGFNKITRLLEPTRKDITITDETLGGSFCFHAHAQENTKQTILYLHGGGYILGLRSQSSEYRYIIAELAAACQANVWAIEYRLAPEHPYPAALEDAYSSYLALLNKGIEAKDIFVMGDSAGGGLTLALLMKLRDEGKPLPKGAIPLSPWSDLLGTGESMTTRAALDPLLTQPTLGFMASSTVNSERMREPYISPLYGNYEGLPPLMIVVGGREVLYDDSIRVAEKAKLAGVDVTLDINEEMFHIYPVFGGVFKEGKEAVNRIANFVMKHSE